MSKRPEKCWSLWCDWPGCGYQFEDGDYSIFGDGYDADLIVTDGDGWIGVDGKHYCHNLKHRTAWSSDHEDGDPYPEPPFLLIHDGMKGYEDGRVTYVDHLHDREPCLSAAACPRLAIETEAAHYDSLVIAEGVTR